MSLITIVTINYNDKEGLQATLKSVHLQSFKSFEHIIIDGDSKDGSVELLKSSPYNYKYISEPDTGVYNAMNKGVKMATSKYLIFLNAGDTFCNEHVLEKSVAYMDNDIDLYYGNLYFSNGEKSFVKDYPAKLNFNLFYNDSLPHPASFIKKQLFEDHFYYNEAYRIVSDWEFFVYVICKAGVSYQHIDVVVSNFDLNGMSNDPKNKVLIEKERAQVLQKHFAAFMEDYKTLNEQHTVLQKPNFKRLGSISNTKAGRKWSARLLKGLNKFYK